MKAAVTVARQEKLSFPAEAVTVMVAFGALRFLFRLQILMHSHFHLESLSPKEVILVSGAA